MDILICNDDGIESPGILALADGLSTLGNITVVAPHRERSTAGHSLTLHKPLRIKEIMPKYFAVTGTPADCVYVATRRIMSKKPDIIVSGINDGANLGNDIYYSGTVAAAREGAYWGVKSFAFSLCFGSLQREILHWASAVSFAKDIIPQALKENYPVSMIHNVNVPNLPLADIKGLKLSKQGRRYYSDEIDERIDPRHKPYYWLGGEYKGFEDIPGSDCVHVDQGFVSVTPLKVDSTDFQYLEEFKKWEKKL